MGIRIAREDDFKGIRNIWEERFTTDKNYLDTLFSHIMPYCRSYVFCENGKILSAISLMPMLFVNSELGERSSGNTYSRKKIKGWYMFGVATLLHAEGRKLAQSIIREATQELETEGFGFIFERPANQSLNRYYLNLGFSISIQKYPFQFNNIKYGEILAAQSGGAALAEISSKVKAAIGENFTKRFIWSNHHILEGLIKLGELRDHILTYKENPPENETYIAVNPLKTRNPEQYKETFFCFPME